MRVIRVAQAFGLVDLVAITPTLAGTGQYPCLLQIGDNALHGALGNPDLFRRFAQAQVRVFRKANSTRAWLVKNVQLGPAML